jgi:hypothetical protein
MHLQGEQTLAPHKVSKSPPLHLESYNQRGTGPFYCAFLPFCEMPWSCLSHSHLLAISGIKLLGQNFNPRYPRASRAVVGWSMADHMRAELVNQALSMALCQRQPAAGLLVHTDRGSQYGADSYRQLLAQHGIEPSMSRKGNCWDNAVAESFFHTLKTELIYPDDFDTHEQVQMAVFEYIEVFYNRQRCHSANSYLAPLAYEQALKTHGIFCPEKC